MASNSPLNRGLNTIESYIAYEPPVSRLVEDAERGSAVPYEDRWADEIFTWFASGRTLVSYCQQPNKPARSLVLTWVNDDDPLHDHLRDRFEKGLVLRAMAMIDEAGDVANEPLMMGAFGSLDPSSMADKKQRFEARLRLAALMDPVKFSPTNKVAQQIALTQINVTQKNVSEMTDEALLRVIAEVQLRMARGNTTNPGAASGDRGTGAVSPPQRPQLTS